MDYFLVSPQPIQPSTHQCFRCLQIYPKEILYSRNCPHKQKLPVSHSQIKYCRFATEQQLCRAKANINNPHKFGYTNSEDTTVAFKQLCQAVCCGDKETLEEMLYSKRFSHDINQSVKMSCLLAWAMYKRQFSVFHALMDFHERCGKLLNLDSTSYFSEKNTQPLLVYAARMNFTQGVHRLLKGGANVNVTDKDKRTALWTACSVKCVKTVELLLDYGAKIDAADNEGISPFMVSVRAMEPNFEIIMMLIRNGSSFSSPAWCPSVFYYILQNTNKMIVNMALLSCQLSPEQIYKTVLTFLLNLSYIYERGYTDIHSLNTCRTNLLHMKEMREYLTGLGYTTSPVLPSLQSLCRKTIRQTLKENYVGKLEKGLEQLGLPHTLKLFVQLRNI
ncbi:XP_029633610.1uncharacterized protein LOC115209373 [Octopus vulgaris]|uniref:XP_029633610.1uncharacterized protein LOC115209373 n=2 Tax=Octopus TaxID=6643 RepID=A0AA36AP36_OCTVU|nr:uncharacterized protein LOC115209373 [Octopus sinensis]XP_029633612.1 uncharacterized protein LOC115209373 [Octopus sinensis]CAI9719730.1 XP_029633610.1uncharacterized protein LOC115209373 [Octopus vulgaris]